MESLRVKEKLLISPYGGALVNLLVPADEAVELKSLAESLPSITLSERSVCDLELLATGAFSPLDRFMPQADYVQVVERMRLASGHIFPIPITLPISDDVAVRENTEIALRNRKQDILAVLRVEEIYDWNRSEYCRHVLATESPRHPIVNESRDWGSRFVSGPMRVLALPRHFDFPELRLTPHEVRLRLEAFGNPEVVAFQTRNPLHRAHEELTKRAIEGTGGVLLMQPVVGMTNPGDIDHYSRVRTYKILTEKYYDEGRVLLALLPLAMRLAGPREALWHALIRRNYGANFFIVGRDHASPGVDEKSRPFYEPYEAVALAEQFSEELGVRIIPFEELVYMPETGTYQERSTVDTSKSFFELSGNAIRREYLDKGLQIPDWYMRPEVAEILGRSYPPKHQQGVCIWFTGLSASGKSTTAEILSVLLSSRGRQVTLLDGDLIRTNLSAGLGFDKAGRDANIRRIGYVASEIARHGGLAICAAISPYRQTRDEVRKMVGGNFIEVFVATPLGLCEERDPKGMYAKARRGEIENFTGVDDTYEEPMSPEVTIETVDATAEENAHSILALLIERGFVNA